MRRSFISKIFSELGGKATEAASEIPLGQEGFAKYTIPTKPDKSSKTAKGAAAGGAAAGDEDGEHRDVYDIADKILSQIKCGKSDLHLGTFAHLLSDDRSQPDLRGGCAHGLHEEDRRLLCLLLMLENAPRPC